MEKLLKLVYWIQGYFFEENNSLIVPACLGTIYQPLRSGRDMTQGQFFKRSLTGLNSEFSFS